jgi:hypothetical protein
MNMQVPSMIQALLLSVALGLLIGCAPRGGYPVQHARTVSASEVPSTVLTAFQEKFPGATIVWVGAFGSGTNAAYSIQFTQAGKSLAVAVDTFGDVGGAYEPVPAKPNR